MSQTEGKRILTGWARQHGIGRTHVKIKSGDIVETERIGVNKTDELAPQGGENNEIKV